MGRHTAKIRSQERRRKTTKTNIPNSCTQRELELSRWATVNYWIREPTCDLVTLLTNLSISSSQPYGMRCNECVLVYFGDLPSSTLQKIILGICIINCSQGDTADYRWWRQGYIRGRNKQVFIYCNRNDKWLKVSSFIARNQGSGAWSSFILLILTRNVSKINVALGRCPPRET